MLRDPKERTDSTQEQTADRQWSRDGDPKKEPGRNTRDEKPLWQEHAFDALISRLDMAEERISEQI